MISLSPGRSSRPTWVTSHRWSRWVLSLERVEEQWEISHNFFVLVRSKLTSGPRQWSLPGLLLPGFTVRQVSTVVMLVKLNAALDILTSLFTFVPFRCVQVLASSILTMAFERMKQASCRFYLVIHSTSEALPVIQSFKVLCTKLTLHSFIMFMFSVVKHYDTVIMIFQ